MKRAGLILFGLVAVIFLTEGTLSLLRHRTILVDLRGDHLVVIKPTATPQITPTATIDPNNSNGVLPTATLQATPAVVDKLTIAPDGTIFADISWDYKIGPRFPRTTVRAEALDDHDQIVASAEQSFSCESAGTLECTGNLTLALRHAVFDTVGTANIWPTGSYTVRVSQKLENLNTSSKIYDGTFRVILP